MKIAILDTVPRSCWDHDEGITDGQKFVSLLSLTEPGGEYPVFYVTEDEFPRDEEVYDGFLITGSPASVHDDEPWIHHLTAFIQRMHEQKTPLAGFCFGHQLIAKSLGGTVGPNEEGWLIGQYDIQIDHPMPWMQPDSPVTPLFHFNKERVKQLPEQAVPFGHCGSYNDFGFVIGEHILALQSHPEQPGRAILNFVRAMGDGLEPALAESIFASVDPATPPSAIWSEWTHPEMKV